MALGPNYLVVFCIMILPLKVGMVAFYRLQNILVPRPPFWEDENGA
jgi:hypothetical protein